MCHFEGSKSQNVDINIKEKKWIVFIKFPFIFPIFCQDNKSLPNLVWFAEMPEVVVVRWSMSGFVGASFTIPKVQRFKKLVYENIARINY